MKRYINSAVYFTL